MLIMPTTATDFQALADSIVKDFFSEHVPLADGIVKVALAHEFTPEEVTRLTEKTNLAASLFVLKTASDKKATFTLANIEDVLKKTHTLEKEEDHTKTASAYSVHGFSQKSAYSGLPIKKGREIDLGLIFPCGQHGTGSDIHEKNAALRNIFSLEKQLDELKQKKLAEELNVQDGLDFLASEFHVMNGPDFMKFAADSLATYGQVSSPVIEGLATYLRIPWQEIEKVASNSSSDYIDDTSPHMKIMSAICDGMRTIVKLANKIETLEQTLAVSWQEAKGGHK